ncbi:ATP-binding cassette domain-containing protein [Geminicoccaceae bacterium 1502E]|nr:ATP-binding cassette domain-containing protein [Geminicoccaceae bacterium 1502E]
MNGGQAVIARLEGVGLRYGGGREVLRGVDLALEAGSFQFLAGPSGAGKSSLLGILALGHQPTDGRAVIFGRDCNRLEPAEAGLLRRRIGVIFQDLRLLDHQSVFDNVALPLRIAGAGEEQVAAMVSPLLGWLGLSEMLEESPAHLSLGQRQLVAAARAVVTRPGLLLADEPTSSLDPTLARRLMQLLRRLGGLGTTVLIATHQHELLAEAGQRVLWLEGGRLQQGPQEAARACA